MSSLPADPDAWRSALRRNSATLHSVCEGLGPSDLLHAPLPGAWGIARCVDHLNRVTGLAVPVWMAALGSAAAGPRAPWRPTWLERRFIAMLGPRLWLRAPVPPLYLPAERPDPDLVLAEFERLRAQVLDAVDRAESMGQLGLRTPSPAARWLRMSLGAWFAATLVHEQYHLAQAWRVRSALMGKTA